MVGVQLTAARGIVEFLGHREMIGMSTFAVNMLVSLTIAAGTDYAHLPHRSLSGGAHDGSDPRRGLLQMFHGTAHVVLGSGLTIAGATYCLTFTRMPYFQTLGVPCAWAFLRRGGRADLGAGDRQRRQSIRALRTQALDAHRAWRRIGTAIVRWPGPILAATLAVALIGLAALPGYQTSYNDRRYIPQDIPANKGFAAADRHFPRRG